jgi:AbrB family looped-hinge helix DNA binding protein
MRLMRVRRASQLTIPAAVCRELHIKPGDYLDATIVDTGLLLRRVDLSARKVSSREDEPSGTIRRKRRRR